MPMSWDQRHIRKAEQKRLQQWGIAEGNCTMSFVPAHDGWQLAVSGYSSQPTKGLPVLLCHGMGANRLTFDLDADISLARYLAAQGYDVYTVDLRAHGKSEKPSWTGRRKWNWGFNDYVYQDLPAVIDFILAETGQEQLNFVGHSMGGILLYCLAALGDQRIAKGITIGSSLDYSGTATVFRHLMNIKGLCYALPAIPIHWPSIASGWGSQFTRKAIDPVLVCPENIELDRYRKLAAVCLHPVSGRVVLDLAKAISGDGITTPNGDHYHALLQQLGYGFPILSLAGSADLQCPPEAAARFGTEHRIFGRAYGEQVDYGHDDLVLGKFAPDETWPVILEWLDR